MERTRSRQSFDAYTERAIRATEAGKLIPQLVYLPKLLRGEPVRVTQDNLRLTLDPPTIKENHVRIAEADPVGFLLAVMHGQPIPEFRITKQGGVEMFYVIPDLEHRTATARWLGSRVTLRLDNKNKTNGNTNTNDWDTMVHNAGGNDADGNTL